MTRDQWNNLKIGDIIIEMRSNVERRVMRIRRWNTGCSVHTVISLIKLRQSWTKSQYTHYFNTDDRGRWRLKMSEDI